MYPVPTPSFLAYDGGMISCPAFQVLFSASRILHALRTEEESIYSRGVCVSRVLQAFWRLRVVMFLVESVDEGAKRTYS